MQDGIDHLPFTANNRVMGEEGGGGSTGETFVVT